ncbi:MAG: Trk system potassium transporter TrkA [Actinobacteria bacterium]|nr:Trk system potassium transporter TrkA [Actinomycetota bacterium]
MKIFVVGAGQVGATVVEALHSEHDLTLIDLDPGRLSALSNRYELRPVQGNAASRRVLQEAGLVDGALFIACTSRDETNIVAAMFAKRLAPEITTIVRTTREEYVEIWRERELEIDHVVSTELETAHAVSRLIGVPAARQTDIFAEGQVQMVEFDVEEGAQADVVGLPLRRAEIPPDSKVASIIRGDRTIVPRGDESIEPGDRIVVIGSPEAARAWSQLLSRSDRAVDDVVIVGAGETGVAIARLLLEQQIRVRMLEADAARAREVAELLPEVRVFHTSGLEQDFIERERIGHARAAILAMPEDAKNLYAATLAKLHGVRFTVAIVHDPLAADVFERAGVDVAVNPRTVTAEEIVRFAHDPRVLQLSMLEGDRFEVLDITVREDSALCGKAFRELPMTGSLIGAIVRDGRAIFPHGDDMLQPGDRAIIFTESSRVPQVERAL